MVLAKFLYSYRSSIYEASDSTSTENLSCNPLWHCSQLWLLSVPHTRVYHWEVQSHWELCSWTVLEVERYVFIFCHIYIFYCVLIVAPSWSGEQEVKVLGMQGMCWWYVLILSLLISCDRCTWWQKSRSHYFMSTYWTSVSCNEKVQQTKILWYLYVTFHNCGTLFYSVALVMFWYFKYLLSVIQSE